MTMLPDRSTWERGIGATPVGETLHAPSRLQVWLMAVRPRTLPLSLLPVIVGSAWAWLLAGTFDPAVALCAALAAAAIQIGTNLYNDVRDHTRGVDTALRLGPRRVTQSGLLPPRTVVHAAWAAFGAAAVPGLYLCLVGGWPILALGVASVFLGWLYSGGRVPLSFTPLGEVFAFLFFGVAAVAGTASLHGAAIGPPLLAAGAAMGAPCAALLLVNNHRDRSADRAAGRRTLAILLGAGRSHGLYALLLLVPAVLAVLPGLRSALGASANWLLLTVPVALGLALRFRRAPIGRELNRFLGLTVAYQALVGALLTVAAATA